MLMLLFCFLIFLINITIWERTKAYQDKCSSWHKASFTRTQFWHVQGVTYFEWGDESSINKLSNTHFLCDFDHASSLLCRNKLPTRCNRGFYCRSYCFLNMFRAPLCPSAEGYVSGLQDAAASCKPDTEPSAPHQTSNLKTTARNTTGSNHRIILLSSWWWA